MDRRPLPRRRHAPARRPLKRHETHLHLRPRTNRPRPNPIRPETFSGRRERTRKKSSLPSRSLYAPEASMNSKAPTNVFHPETSALGAPSNPFSEVAAQISRFAQALPPCPPVSSVVKAFLAALCEPLRFKIFVCLASCPRVERFVLSQILVCPKGFSAPPCLRGEQLF